MKIMDNVSAARFSEQSAAVKISGHFFNKSHVNVTLNFRSSSCHFHEWPIGIYPQEVRSYQERPNFVPNRFTHSSMSHAAHHTTTVHFIRAVSCNKFPLNRDNYRIE
jgi:hypothetical protein